MNELHAHGYVALCLTSHRPDDQKADAFLTKTSLQFQVLHFCSFLTDAAAVRGKHNLASVEFSRFPVLLFKHIFKPLLQLMNAPI